MLAMMRPNESRLGCGALKKDSFPNLRRAASFKRLLGAISSRTDPHTSVLQVNPCRVDVPATQHYCGVCAPNCDAPDPQVKRSIAGHDQVKDSGRIDHSNHPRRRVRSKEFDNGADWPRLLRK